MNRYRRNNPRNAPEYQDMTVSSNSEIITLSWEHVKYTIFKRSKRGGKVSRTLLNDISGVAVPGSITGIMGASGAGKTTLLNVLAGRIGKGELSGRILVNGEPRQEAIWKSQIAYVEQNDLLLENFTVYETLLYAAKLRLPRYMSLRDKESRVQKMINILGLSRIRDSRIGGEGRRGISGGEKKRVSIGVELITEKKLVFLDEPTSGLDSFTAGTVIESLKRLAVEERCTIIITIHQPRESILKMIDQLFLLSESRVVYNGPVYAAIGHFARCGFFLPPETNPADFFLDIMTLDTRSETLEIISRGRIMTLQASWIQPEVPIQGPFAPKNVTGKPSAFANNLFGELAILLRRDMSDAIRDPASLLAHLFQSIVFFLIIGFVFFQIPLSYEGIQDRIGSLFFIVINAAFANASATIAVFPMRIQFIKRERAAGAYRALSAYLSASLAILPPSLIAEFIFAASVYYIIGYKNNFINYLNFIATLLLVTIAADALGLFISSLVKTVRVGQIIAPLIIILFVIFAGQFVNLKTTPGVLQWIQWISFPKYAFAALSINEFTGLTFGCQPEISFPGCTVTGEQILSQYSLDTFSNIWINNLFIIIITIVFYIAGFFMFLWRSRPLMRLELKSN